ncbi:MAG: glycosyltransferase family 9 protein [Ktedonobacteraceae bacterium]
MKRIAVFRALQLGDLLLAIPAFRALRHRFPHAEITLISLPWAASFVRRFNCYIDRFVEFVGYPGIDEVRVDTQRVERFLAEQRAYRYDIVLQMHGNGHTSNPFALALGAPSTIGYYEKTPDGLTIGAVYPDDQHEIYRNLNLVALLVRTDVSRPKMGAEGEHVRAKERRRHVAHPHPQDAIHRSLHLEFPLFASDYEEADELLHPLRQGSKRMIGIHPGARPPARRWPAAYFASVADTLAQYFNAQILLTGGPGEEQTVQAVADLMHTSALVLAGKTSLGGLAALLSQLDLFISNDTGPAHIACAVDCPSVTIFGPADVRRWAPLNRQRHPIVRHPVACSPCGYWECPIDHRCLRWLLPETVLTIAQQILLQDEQAIGIDERAILRGRPQF